jgi:hypothetical protein
MERISHSRIWGDSLLGVRYADQELEGGAKMKRAIRWEYLTVCPGHMTDEQLNELGAKGWEVVKVFPADDWGKGQEWLFKRERRT